MGIVFTFIHIVVSVFLVLVVLLQTGKRADLAGAFGGGGSQTAFGTRGAATLLAKLTTVAAVVFMVTSLGLSILSSRSGTGSGSVLDDVDAAQVEQPAPSPDGGAPAGLPPVEPIGDDPGTTDPTPTDEAPAEGAESGAAEGEAPAGD